MKHYDSIPYYNPRKIILTSPFIAFDKLDGSNLRFEWNYKNGFYKFGARKQMRSEDDADFSKAFNIFVEKYDEGIRKVFESSKYKKDKNAFFTCFGEYCGPKSEFGQHDPDDTHDVVLFDVNVYKRGLVKPKEFIDDFGHLGIPKVVYNGEMSENFVNAIKNNEYNLSEGVICKAVEKTRKDKEKLVYFKLKTDNWLERLKARYGEKALLEELSN